MKLTLSSLMVPAALLLLAGCGDVYFDLCERGAECGGGSEADVEACVEELAYKEEVACLYECEDLFDSYITCLDDHGACDGDKLSGCDEQKDRYKDCIDDRETREIKVDLRAE